MDKIFVIMFHFIDFYNISFGINFCFNMPNIEIHIPFGFIKIGFDYIDEGDDKRIFRLSSKKLIFARNKRINL
jgi:hypothetical protein